MEGVEQLCFQIITSVGTAKSCYLEAISHSKKNDIKSARESIEIGNKHFIEGHHAHASLLEMEANDSLPNLSLLIMHAEDQMMSAEMAKTMAEEFIYLYEKHIYKDR